MRIRFYFFILCLFTYSIIPLWAQSGVLPLFQKVTGAQNASRPVPQNAAFVTINSTLFDAVVPSQLNEIRIPDFPLTKKQQVTLRCTTMNVLSNEGIVVEGTHSGDVYREQEKYISVKGSIEGIENSFVYLTFFRTYSMGFIEVPEAGSIQRYIIAPDNIEATTPTMIVYNQLDVPSPPRPECHAEDLPDYQRRADAVFASLRDNKSLTNNSSLQNAQTLVAQIAIDCDTKYFTAHGSNFTRAANYALVLMGAVSAIYQRDMNIMIQVPYLRIWTSNCPYSGDNGAMLGQVRTYWNTNMKSVKRSLVYLFTSYAGGLAWVGVLCGDYGYSVGGPGNSVNYPANAYVWDSDVVSHEIGHNFGSPHTHNCGWAPPVDSCVTSEGGCYATPLPRKGTIMSYCHLTNFGTELRFHPRVATLIRSSAQRQLNNCIHNLTPTYSIDVAVVSITIPANGAKVVKGTTFTPQSIIRNVGTQNQSNIQVTYTITLLGNTTPVYTSTKTIGSLTNGFSVVQSFDATSLNTNNTYQATVSITMNNDGNLQNNALSRPFVVENPSATAVQVTYPNGGEDLLVDSTVTITWTHSNIDQALVELTTDDGLSWQTIKTFQPAKDLKLQWKVPALTTTSARIRITDMANSMVYDVSNNVFTIRLDNDAQALEFVYPQMDSTVTAPFSPKVMVRNNGLNELKDVNVTLRLQYRNSGLDVYNRTVAVPVFPAGSTITIPFPSVAVLPPGQHLMLAKITAAKDRNPANDSIGRMFTHKGGIAPPLGLRGEAVNKATLLWWSASLTKDITRYTLMRGTHPDTMRTIATLPTTILSYVDESVQNSIPYYYTIIAERNSERSVYSNIIQLTPNKRLLYDSLTAVRALVPEHGVTSVPNPVQFTWTSINGGMCYQVQISQGTDTNTVVGNYILTTNEPIVLPLTFKQTYTWRVRACNYNNTTPWSKPNTFTIGSNCAGNLLNFTTSADNLSAPTFEWKAGGPTTVEFWNYVASSDASASQFAFRVGVDNAANRFSVTAPFTDGQLYWDYGNINTNGRLKTDYSPYLDKWTHVAVVSDGKTFKAIYLDGKLIESAQIADEAKTLTGLRISVSHRGKIDEFRVWNKVRTADEIASTLNKRLTTPVNGLVSYYRFDENVKDTILADQGAQQAPGYLNSSRVHQASDAPINCTNNTTLTAPILNTPPNQAISPFPVQAVTWNTVTNAQAYQVQVSRTPDFTTVDSWIPNVATVATPVLGLLPKTTYYWRARAINALAVSQWSTVWTFTTDTVCGRTSVPEFNGTNKAQVPDFKLTSGEVTIEWWHYVDSASVRNSSAFAVGTADDGNNRCQAHVPWSDRKIYWDFGSTSGGRISTDYTPYIGKWTHVAVVSDGKNFKGIYLNGQLVESGTIAESPRNLQQLTIGQQITNNGFKGRITEFRFWNRVRTNDEILRFMNTRITKHPNLLGYWQMNEGAGNIMIDATIGDTSAHKATFTTTPSWINTNISVAPVAPQITGRDTVLFGNTTTYSVPFNGGTIAWTVGAGASIVSGAGTGTITLQWGSNDTISTITASIITTDGCVTTVTKRVVILNPLSAPTDATQANAIVVIPNPATNNATLLFNGFGETTVEVRTLLGELVYSTSLLAQDSDNRVLLPLGGFASGMYLVQLRTGAATRSTMMQVIR
ncbi:MAG: LamG-like jellyroll fold domain-containing protein [Candidatus Kapaibacterium sp.]|nr:T9SS type A sorting domain-containing protein [Bacteroidota bacterium]